MGFRDMSHVHVSPGPRALHYLVEVLKFAWVLSLCVQHV